MQGFLDDLDRSERKHRPEKMKDFRKVLNDVANHASERYFILKSIIVGNLYGVDIMEEAVEICKLRLFLKLVAQLENYDQIEPLPDIDFNIRAGNTLVGFVSMDEIQKAFTITADGQHRVLYPEDKAKLDRIEEDAEIADRAFGQFCKMQADPDMDANAFTKAKVALRNRLDDLREELDGYLASEYGKKTDDAEAYGEWRSSHQPFHWFIEFYGIMHQGGFDVVIGNPPYKPLKDVNQYRVKGYECAVTGNLYAVMLERSMLICRSQGRSGFIVPVSSISTDGYASLQDKLSRFSLHYSSFDDRPSRLFDGLQHIRLSIHLIAPAASAQLSYSTRYNKWNAMERVNLFSGLRYARSRLAGNGLIAGTFPKLCSEHEHRILEKLGNEKATLAHFYTSAGENRVYYTRKVGHFLQFLDFEPRILDGWGNRRSPSELKILCFGSDAHAKMALSCFNSSLFYWFMKIFSDCRNVNKREVDSFPMDMNQNRREQTEFIALADELMNDLRKNSEERQMKFRHDTLTVQCILPKHSKSIIDRIDRALAAHYGFTDEELDFIINYDIKYRMGRDNLSGKKE